MECALSYEAQLESFPGPVFKPTRCITLQVKEIVEKNATTNAPTRETTRQALAELDVVYKEAYGQSFTTAVASCPGLGVEVEKTEAERKKLKHKLQWECRDHIRAQIKQGDALNALAEGKSLESYKRMHVSVIRDTSTKTWASKEGMEHSTTFANVQWDKEGLLDWTTGKRVS